MLLDFTDKRAAESISKDDVLKALKKIDHIVRPFDIVLIYTGADQYWLTREYFYKFPGVSREATAWLVEQGVKIIGIDALGFDRRMRRLGLCVHRQLCNRDYLRLGHRRMRGMPGRHRL